MQNRILLIMIIISLILGASTLTRGHIWGDDFASYIMQAESILNGRTHEFVQHNSLTIFQSSNQIGPVAYPWGYPLILTPIYAVKGNNPLALKLPALFFYAGFLVCLYLLMKIRLTQTESLLIVSLFAFNPMFLQFLDQIVSDIPFLFFSTSALLLMIWDREDGAIKYVALGCAIASAFFIRATGILLLASFLAMQVVYIWKDKANHERFKASWRNILIVSTTFGLLWLIYSVLFPGGGESYFAEYQIFQIKTALGSISSYFQVFGRFFGEQIIWKILYYLMTVFFLLGLWKRQKEDVVFILFFAFYIILLISWPYMQGPRFIFPLLPIFIYFTFQGMKYVLGKLPEIHALTGQWLFYGFWSLIAIIFLFNSGINAYSNLKNHRAINGPYDSFSKEVYNYIKEKTPAESVVIFFKPRAMRLMTNRDSIMITQCNHILKGDYLVLSKKVENNQQIPPERISACNLPLTTVLTNNRFIVYKIQK